MLNDRFSLIATRTKPLLLLAVLVWSFAGNPSLSQAEELQAITTPSMDITLSFVVAGRLAEVLVKEGDLVNKNQLLAHLDDKPERIQAEQLKAQAVDTTRIMAAEAELAQKRVDLKKLELAKTKGAASEWEIEHVRLGVRIAELSLMAATLEHEQYQRRYAQAVSQLERMRLVSPIEGRVENVVVKPGEAAKTLGPVIQVVKIDPLWIDVPVPLTQAKQLSLGQKVPVIFPGGDTVKSPNGRIIHVSSLADAASDTLRVRIEVANPVGRPAGERVTVKFLEGKDAAGVVEKQEQEPPRADLERIRKTHSARAHQSEQDQNQRERVSEKPPFDVSEQQPRPRDSQGEVYLGKVMTLTYAAYTREPDQKFYNRLTELSHSLKMPVRKNYRVVLKGYTDSTGSRDDNLRISLQRAERLRELLAQNPHMAIDKERITVEGHGPSNPVASNNTFEGRAQNRRVEIHIYGDASVGGDFADYKWAHQPEQDQDQRERVSEKPAFDVLEQQERKHRDSEGEVYLGKVMTLTYPAYTREPEQRYHRLLTELAHSLKVPVRKNYRVVLKGYTDRSGSVDDNLRISLQRAERLKELLAQNPHMAINGERITVEGHGPFNPVVSNQTAEGRAQNRRVEIHIYGDVSEGDDFADYKDN